MSDNGFARDLLTMATPLEPLELDGNPLGQEIELTVSTLSLVNGVPKYTDATITDINGNTVARDYYAVVKLIFYHEDKQSSY